jgi:hypothetical protein
VPRGPCKAAMSPLILKRASASRPSGEWNDDDYDVLADGVVVGRIMEAAAAPVGTPWLRTLRAPRRPHADARGRYGGIREELAAKINVGEGNLSRRLSLERRGPRMFSTAKMQPTP